MGRAAARCSRCSPGSSSASSGRASLLRLALVHTLLLEAQPSDVFVAHAIRARELRRCCSWSRASPCSRRPRVAARAAALVVRCARPYAATLMILEVSERSGGQVDTAFQRGHTAVSALWGSSGCTPLRRPRSQSRAPARRLRLFGISLAKLFVYDLAFLSSVARAFSFLAVGGC